MLTEPTSLANLVYLIGETLSANYDVDPVPLYEEIGVDPGGLPEAGTRHTNATVNRMWELAAEASGDPALGVKVGMNVEPSFFYVLGHAFLASETIADALRRLVRYEEILDSGTTEILLEKLEDSYVVSETYPNPADHPGQMSVDSSISGLYKLCEMLHGEPVKFLKLELMWSKDTPKEIYAEFMDGPIVLEADRNAIHLPAADLDAPLSSSIPDVVEATTSIAERYIESLDSSKIAHQVRELLVQMLPSGSVDQDKVASKLYCSASTLQRQLSSEGTSYRDVLKNTRRSLAEAYLVENKHSHSQIAFLVGFSDQSNFARAFKRWTGQSPGQFQKAAAQIEQ